MLLSIDRLEVTFAGQGAEVPAVRGVSFDVGRGETVAVVGESGCGKSVTALALMGLLPGSTRVSGSVKLDGRELLGLPPRELQKVRGGAIAMVFQEPMTSLNPVLRIGRQLEEVLELHRGFDRRQARKEAVALLGHVGIASPEHRAGQYPHELSGGMKQRVMIAMAVAGRPQLLIADEPTTALDVTIQAQILNLLRALCREHGMALLLITHDLGIVAHYASRVNVMYGGKLVERAPVTALFDTPAHPYTRALLGALPRHDGLRSRLDAIPGRVPPPDRLPRGCPFTPRCRYVLEPCASEMPALLNVRQSRDESVSEQAPGAEGRTHQAACWAVQAEQAASAEASAGKSDRLPP
jgi:peptide/nickel transport system ATP-binding protein